MKKKLFCLMVLLVLVFSSAAMSEAAANPDPYRTAGAHVTFGTYPQTAEGTDETPIEWLVLEYDEENHRSFLLSYYGLDAKPYNRYRDNTTWETCTLRTWLNDDFLNRAFTPEEQTAILTTDVGNGRDDCYGWNTPGGKDTQDKIFLLSYAEAHKYFNIQFGVKNNMAARMSPTDYAYKAGAYYFTHNKTGDGNVTSWWSLRSPGCYRYCSAVVGTDGSLYHTYVDSNTCCVRPAFWLDLDADVLARQE